jgi:glycerol uptake facilitator protein
MSAATTPAVTATPVRATALPLGTPAAYAAELLGTFVLVLFIVLAVSATAAPPAGTGNVDVVLIALTHAFALFLLVRSLGAASGAHFNPAVTVALLFKRKIEPRDAGAYIVLQCVGAILAALFAGAIMGDAAEAVNYAGPAVTEDRFADGSMWLGALAEGTAAFVLMWAILATAVDPRGNRDWAPLVIGLSLGLGVLVMAPVTGAAINPARAFGPLLVGDFGGFGDFLIAYVAGPILGALAAAALYTEIVLKPQERIEQRPHRHPHLTDIVPAA